MAFLFGGILGGKLKNIKLKLLEDQKMKGNKYFKDRRVGDPYVDRRSGEDRRQVYDSGYWESVGIERNSFANLKMTP